jgi:hypothetical protein
MEHLLHLFACQLSVGVRIVQIEGKHICEEAERQNGTSSELRGAVLHSDPFPRVQNFHSDTTNS